MLGKLNVCKLFVLLYESGRFSKMGRSRVVSGAKIALFNMYKVRRLHVEPSCIAQELFVFCKLF